MTVYSCSVPPVLTCVLFNTCGRLVLHDDLHQHQFERLRRLLQPSGGTIELGGPPCAVQLSWIRPQNGSHQGRPIEFMICRGEDPLLVAGLAADHVQSTSLWNCLVLLKRRTFRCLDAPPHFLTPPGNCPWLGMILMPGALDLSNDHLDALCGLGQTVGQVWLRLHFRPGRTTAIAGLTPKSRLRAPSRKRPRRLQASKAPPRLRKDPAGQIQPLG